MKKLNEKLIVLLILGVLVHQYRVNCFFTLVLSLIEFAWSAFEVVNTVHDTYSKVSTPSTADLMEKSEEIAQSLDNWGGRLEDKIQQSVDLLLTRLPLLGEISSDIQLLNSYVGRIDELYQDYRFYLEDREGFDADELRALVDIFKSREKGDVQDTVAQMFNLIVPHGLSRLKKSLFLLLTLEAQSYDIDLCGTGGSPQQRLMQFYDVLIETEMRAYTMTIFGYTMDGYMRSVNRSSATALVRNKLMRRAKEYLVLFKSTIGQTPTIFRQCDPFGGHERGVTYLEFEKFLSASIITVEGFGDGCHKTCSAYTALNRMYPNYCDGAMCEWNSYACAGWLAECTTMSGEVEICPNSSPEGRRFQYFKDADNTWGDNSRGCSAEKELFKEYYKNDRLCTICRCMCWEGYIKSKSNHFISLREQITNVEDNMVVTGVQFVMKNRILYVQIMQGKLGPYADIPSNSTSWVELEDLFYDEEHSKNQGYFMFYKTTANGNKLEEGDVVYTLTPREKRINLDFLFVPENHVITGVRFQRFYTGGPLQVQLEIRATSFDVETGQLNVTSSHWITPEDMPYAKEKETTRLNYGEVNGKLNPIQSRVTKIDSKPYSFIDVDHSDMSSDAAQTTIPLLDAIPVVTNPPIPIVAVGLFHKRQPGYGGFLTFVLEGINLAKYLPTDG